MDFSESTPRTVDKVQRYNWVTKGAPGDFQWIDKTIIQVDPSYQRSDVSKQKISVITQSWSWIACGVITIANRNGTFWAIDGQHRVLASLRRSDISKLPCIVFETTGSEQEARGFLEVNTSRRPVTAKQKHKAMVTAGDVDATYVQEQLSKLGLSSTKDDTSAGYFNSFAWAMKTVAESRETFKAVIELAAEICHRDDEPIPQVLLYGFTYLHCHHAGGITEKRICERIRLKGPLKLKMAAKRSALLAAAGGAKVWARGILDEINKGLSNKIVVEGLGN